MHLDYRRGRTYGRLTVLGIDFRGGEFTWYRCECLCGELRSVVIWKLERGDITECLTCQTLRKSGMPVGEPKCEQGGCGETAVYIRRDDVESVLPRKLCAEHFEGGYG